MQLLYFYISGTQIHLNKFKKILLRIKNYSASNLTLIIVSVIFFNNIINLNLKNNFNLAENLTN